MKQFLIHPSIVQLETCAQFAETYQLGKGDLILSESYIYDPLFGPLNLDCHVIYQDRYGVGEPSDTLVEAIYQDMPKDITRVIGIGGGAVIDVAKILALDHVSPIVDLYDGAVPICRSKKLILLPSTCGTGSEVTNISILALTSRNTKKGLANDQLYADEAVLIPQLLAGLPFRPFATSAIDALVHAIESSLSPKATAFSKLFGTRAIEMILAGFAQIRDHGQEARQALLSDFQLASTFAGIAFGNAGCGAVHALAYPLGTVYHVPHGESNYALLTGVLSRYLSIKQDGALAALNEHLAALLRCDDKDVYIALENLLNTLIPKKPLREYGMTQADVQLFTDSVRENQQRLMANNFVPLGDKDVYAIYEALL